MRDRNFDDIAEKFSRNIYGTTKGQLRQTILWQDLDKLLAEFGDRPLRVLDAGGGEGQTAILMAQRGHHVTLCDLSAEMVARAGRAAEERCERQHAFYTLRRSGHSAAFGNAG